MLEEIPGWNLAGSCLVRELRFPDFRSAFAFMTAAALAAEKLDHHPDWSNSYNLVRISLTTHDAGGLTEMDFRLAAILNELAST